MNLAYVWLGGVIGAAIIVAVHLLYHWRWCRRWDREHTPPLRRRP